MRASHSSFISLITSLLLSLPLSLAFVPPSSLSQSSFTLSLPECSLTRSSVRLRAPSLPLTRSSPLYYPSSLSPSSLFSRRKPSRGTCKSENKDSSEESEKEDSTKKELPKSLTVQRIENNSYDDSSLFWFGALFEFGLGLTAILFGFILHINPLGPGFSLSPSSLSSSLLLGLLLSLPLSLSLVLLNLSRFRPLREIRAVTDALGRRIFQGKRTGHLLLFSCAAGFGEELLFRGVLQQGLTALSLSLLGAPNTALSLLLVAVAFAFAHWMTPLSFLLSSLFSLAFSAMFIYSNQNILVPMAAHCFFDFFAVQLTLRRLKKQDELKKAKSA